MSGGAERELLIDPLPTSTACPVWCQPERHEEHDNGPKGVQLMHVGELLRTDDGWVVDVCEFVDVSAAGRIEQACISINCRPTGDDEAIDPPLALQLAEALRQAAELVQAVTS